MDWFASLSRPRLNLFSPYSTATAAMLFMTLIMILGGAELKKKRTSPVFLILFALNFAALIMTLARTAIFAFILSFLFVLLIQKRRPVFWLLGSAALLFLFSPWLSQGMDFLLGLREQSTEGRLDIYRTSLSMLQGPDWILGLGIKPREDVFLVPFGSHSMYISLLFKTGIIGTAVFVSFQASLFLKWFRLKSWAVQDRERYALWKTLGWIFAAMAIWFLTDDLDAPQLVAFLYFSVVGFFEGFCREAVSVKEEEPAEKNVILKLSPRGI